MIKIVPLTEDLLNYRVDLLNKQEISCYLNTSEVFTLEKTFGWYRHRDLNTRFDCVFIENDTPVGMGGLSNISKQNRNAELYMYIDPLYQGKGLGKESLYELCKYGFERLNLSKIYLYTFSSNMRANKMYEKVGFVQEGFLRKHTMKNNELQDRCFYGLLKDDFVLSNQL